MPGKSVFLARHGETFFNRNNFVMGRSDSPLTEEGIRTSKELAQALVSEGIEAIYSSPLGRTVFTANLYAGALGVPVNLRDGMAELSCGQWEGQPRSSVTDNAWNLRKTWRERPAGGESFEDAEPRIAAIIQEVRSANVPTVVLVIGHAGTNRVFLKLWLELSEDLAMRIMLPHDVAYILEDSDSVRGRSASGEEFSGLLLAT